MHKNFIRDVYAMISQITEDNVTKKCPARMMSFLYDVTYIWKFKSHWEMESYELIIVMRKYYTNANDNVEL